MLKDYDLLNSKGTPVIKVKRINIHSYNMKGYEGTEFATVYKRVSVDALNTFKTKFNLFTDEEMKRKRKRSINPEPTLMELLVKANFNINTSTGDLEEDNKSETLGKHQLKKVVELLSSGQDITDKVKTTYI